MITVKKQLFDLTYLKQIDEASLISEIINYYLVETQTELLQMKIALDKSDYESIHSIVNKIQISTGVIQADALHMVLEEIRKISKYGGEYGKLCELEYLARYEFDQLKFELEMYLKDNCRQIDNVQQATHSSVYGLCL